MDKHKTPEEEYLNGLDLMKKKLAEVQADIHDLEADHPQYLTEQGWTEAEYKFNACLEFLASKNLKIERVDSEVLMLSLINDLRATDADIQLVNYVTEYWDKYHDVMMLLRQLTARYQVKVLTKLLLMFNDQIILPASNLGLAHTYSREVAEKISSIEKLYNRLSALCLSYQTRVEKQLLENGGSASLVIIRVPRDVIIKLRILVSLSNDLLNREQQFIAEMQCAMLECRKRKREFEEELHKKRQLQLDKIKNVNVATMLLEQNKVLLEQLDKELDSLQTQLVDKENDLSTTAVEIEKDENAIEFLNHTISATKKNRSLLIKRQRLLKTRESLEQKLEQIKSELEEVNLTIQEKYVRKQEVETSVQETESNFDSIKQELSLFTSSMTETEQDVKDIHSQLIDIEILHCIKTSPENLDELRDRPQSVKIARSLRDKITRKRLRQNKA